MQRILVLGAGFAGLWSAIGAARRLDQLGIGPDRIEVTVVNRTAWHSIRVRNYEADLDQTRLPLDEILGPIGVHHVEGEVTDIDFSARRVACSTRGRVGMWRGGGRLGMSVAAPFVWRCLSGSTITPFHTSLSSNRTCGFPCIRLSDKTSRFRKAPAEAGAVQPVEVRPR